MCDTIEEWLTMHPAVPRRSSGDRTHLSIYISNIEMQHISRLITDHRLYGVHRNEASELVRHALHYYIPPVLELLDNGWRPLSELMRADIERAGIGQTIEQIKEYYSTRGRELIMLISIGEVDKAFDHYAHVLHFVHNREGVWGKLLMKMLYEHADMTAFRNAIRRMGAFEENRLRSLEEPYEHND